MILICFFLLFAQSANGFTTVRLPPSSTTIPASSAGMSVEVMNSPSELALPALSPLPPGKPLHDWVVEIKNLGPHEVTIRNGNQFVIHLLPNQSARIGRLSSSGYVRLR